uniref:Uncharacterized protein n=1 Tax=Heterosigma akashiwo TaxID=2829 RepID=A0A7S3UPI8_HETAK
MKLEDPVLPHADAQLSPADEKPRLMKEETKTVEVSSSQANIISSSVEAPALYHKPSLLEAPTPQYLPPQLYYYSTWYVSPLVHSVHSALPQLAFPPLIHLPQQGINQPTLSSLAQPSPVLADVAQLTSIALAKPETLNPIKENPPAPAPPAFPTDANSTTVTPSKEKRHLAVDNTPPASTTEDSPPSKKSRVRGNKNCEYEGGCNKAKHFGFQGDGPIRFCGAHREPGMVNLARKCCEQEGCTQAATYGCATLRKKVFCSAHKKEGMANLTLRVCLHPGCNKTANYKGAADQKIKFCRKHQDNAIGAKNALGIPTGQLLLSRHTTAGKAHWKSLWGKIQD